jgi:hypothetical protein
MKMMKLALLGGAALAVSAIGAQADDLAALKAEIEALNARVAQLEATPAIPSGYSLVSISEEKYNPIPGLHEGDTKDRINFGDTVTQIAILPTADAAPSTVITTTGYSRAAIQYRHEENGGDEHDDGEGVHFDEDEDDWDVFARGELRVSGQTETAVGQVGAFVKWRGNFDGTDNGGNAQLNEAWGWWVMRPGLTLGGGYTATLGSVQFGYDGSCNCYYTDNADVAFNPGDTSQMRITWASGPITVAAAVEDASSARFSGFGTRGDQLGVAGDVHYDGDMFRAEVSGIWRDDDNDHTIVQDELWQAGVGVSFGLGDVATISAAAAAGQLHSGDDYWGASVLGSVNIGDASHAEVAYGHKEYDNPRDDVDAVLAGIYYDPVPQLTIGLDGEWFNVDDDTYSIDLVTVFRF